MPLTAYKEHGFFLPDSLATIEFVLNAKGEVTSLTLTDDADPVAHARTGEQPLERQVVKIAIATFDAYLGRYQLWPGFEIEVKRDGDRFVALAPGQEPIEMLPISDSTFLMKAVDAELKFEKTADGGMQLVLSQNGRKMPGKRI